MKIKLKENCVLELPGVYKIINSEEGKYYVGSSTMKIIKRINHHYNMLKSNTHKNKHLQNAWNKYGEDSFIFEIVENLEKDQCLIREQEFINNEDFCNLYNINPLASGTPNLSQETINKRSETFRKTTKIAKEYYCKLKAGEISMENIPIKYKKMVNSYLRTPWNKGKNGDIVDYSFLKGVKKTRTEKWIKRAKNLGEKMLEKSVNVYVFDLNMNYLGHWKNAHLLEKESSSKEFILKSNMSLRNPNGRNGYSPYYLSTFNIQKAIRTKKQYKGLYFTSQPLCQVIDIEKSDEFRESPEVDNPDPSQSGMIERSND